VGLGRGGVGSDTPSDAEANRRETGEGERSHWVGPDAIQSSNSVYCVCVRVPRTAPLPFRGPSTGVRPSRRPVT